MPFVLYTMYVCCTAFPLVEGIFVLLFSVVLLVSYSSSTDYHILILELHLQLFLYCLSSALLYIYTSCVSIVATLFIMS